MGTVKAKGRGEGVVELIVSPTPHGSSLWPGYPYADESTAIIARHARSWDRIQRLRVALSNSGQASEAGLVDIKRAEVRESRLAAEALQKHVLWDWLEKHKGLRGVTTCLIMGLIRDPRRFPGQKCKKGHYLPAVFEVGASCPVKIDCEYVSHEDADLTETIRDSASEQFSGCGAPILAPRATTGVRSVWRYFGLHAVDGKSARKRKGQQADFSPRGKALVLAPDTGIASQIVRHQCEPWIDLYYENKERLVVAPSGARPPFAIDRLARKIAAKAFLGDLLTAWKDCL